MQFSASIEYAIHGLVYLAAAGSPNAVLLGDIARATAVPESYLRKVFQHMARAGLVASHRGVKGGFTLARGAKEITLTAVVRAIDGALPTYTCMREKRKCADTEACMVSEVFAQARRRMEEVLNGTTIDTLARAIGARSPGWLKVVQCA
jgi:Rrf2 family transcriptional regulator, iron-sulfur cluster assembly transcription factor